VSSKRREKRFKLGLTKVGVYEFILIRSISEYLISFKVKIRTQHYHFQEHIIFTVIFKTPSMILMTAGRDHAWSASFVSEWINENAEHLESIS